MGFDLEKGKTSVNNNEKPIFIGTNLRYQKISMRLGLVLLCVHEKSNYTITIQMKMDCNSAEG
jgi:hypothetical protein